MVTIEEAIKNLKNDDVKVRKEAINALEGTNDEIAIGPLIEATTDESAPIRFQAGKILGNMGDIAMDKLIAKFETETGQNKRLLAHALKETGNPRIIDLFSEAVTDDDFGVRKVAVRTLGELKAEDKIDVLAQGIGDDDWGVRLATVYALGDIATEESLALIKKARRQEKDKDFKKSCNKAIKKAEKSMKGEVVSKNTGKPLKDIKDLEKENIDEAIKDYEEHVKKESNKDVPYKRLAIIYRKKRDTDNEMRILNQAIDLLSKKNPGKEKWFVERLDKMK
ncbi:HEAT repeat domain-containing protein [Methanobrevibacter sp. DSM 116169]|uniref:HEAT repeat domain-containing protein n=1 Tax=Methanobrevibacter sp. DSM 116169 TaxID=3242727 RepID=UPI0038FC8DD6